MMTKLKTKIGIGIASMILMTIVSVNFTITPHDKSMKLTMRNVEALAGDEDTHFGSCVALGAACVTPLPGGGLITYIGLDMDY